MSKQNETVDKVKQTAQKAQNTADNYVRTFGQNTNYPRAKLFARIILILGVLFMLLGLLSLLKGGLNDSPYFKIRPWLRFGPGLAMLFLGSLGAAIGSGLDMIRDHTDRQINAAKK